MNIATQDGSPTEQPAQPPEVPRSFFLRFWKGKQRLWKAFWLLHIGILLFVLAVFLLMRAAGTSIAQATFVIQWLGIPLYTFWVVSVWRCAWRTSHWIFSLLARGYMICVAFGVLASVANLAFFDGKL